MGGLGDGGGGGDGAHIPAKAVEAPWPLTFAELLAFVGPPFRVQKKAPGLRRTSSWPAGVPGPSSSLP